MARIRTIKPEFFRHERLYDAEQETGLPLRLAFAGLWTVADREGRFPWRPRALKPDVLPYDDVDFAKVMEVLAERNFILRYKCDGEEFGYIPSWQDHQVINNRELASKIPPPPTRERKCSDASPTREGNCQGEGKGRELEGNGKEGEGEGNSPPPPKISFEEFYQKYPVIKIQSKPKAEAEWNALDEGEQRKAFEALPGLKAYCASDKTYPVLHAWTFLGERRYLGFAGSGIDPAKTAALKDRADQIMQRGIYAPKDAAG